MRLVCRGCGAAPAPPYPFRCPHADEPGDVDHVLIRILDPSLVRFPTDAADPRPFVRYRHLLHSYHRAVGGGMTDGDYVDFVGRLDDAVAGVDGRGFRVTPFERNDALSDRLGFEPAGGVWIKDETGNVAGSHKGRHVMGLALHLEVAERLGQTDRDRRPDLAIASCGNAALAAAVVARAAGRHLRVLVPVDADAAVRARLEQVEAEVIVCPRRDGERGDPTYVRLREELRAGALPFTCQGNENGLCIEGGQTLGYEIVSSGVNLDHLVVQVGGGALATACIGAFDDAVALGVLARAPRVHTVQTTGAHPLERAYHRVRDDDVAIEDAVRHRSRYMWPWEAPPSSVATGILDDETYDWAAVVSGMMRTDGIPLVVSEARLMEANALGRGVGVNADPTGTAGLAGLIDLRAEGRVGRGDRVAVLFTGVQRAR